jgi:sec-independent protein translocase protein TatC
MGFYDHFEELRDRLMKSLIAFFVGFIGLYFVSEPILAFLRRPLFNALPVDQQKLYFTSLFENFLTHLKVSGYASLFVCSPFIFYQLWKFISPGLYDREKRLVLPFVSAATVFFIGGAAFAYGVLFPVGFKYFVQYGGPADVPLLTIDSYYSTCMKLMLLFGLAFELPVLISLLGALGVIDSEMLRKNRKTAILGITILSALFAPPDAMSMILLGTPLILLYELSIFVVHSMGLKRKKADASVGIGTAPQGGSSSVPVGDVHPWQGRSSHLDH